MMPGVHGHFAERGGGAWVAVLGIRLPCRRAPAPIGGNPITPDELRRLKREGLLD
jgi:hypothetical protein